MIFVLLTVLSLVYRFDNPYFGATEGLTVDCKVICASEVFVFLSVVKCVLVKYFVV